MKFARLSLLLFVIFFFSHSPLIAQIEETEDFESYTIGSFPAPYWNDVRDISIPVTAPNPSATIVETTAWDGSTTKALQFRLGVTTSCGLYRPIDTSQVYHLSADIRIDRWSNSTQAFFTEWAVAVGIFSLRPGWDFNGTPQITFVAQPVAENWVLYALRADTSPFNYYNLEFDDSQVNLDTWYHVEFTLFDDTGIVHTRVSIKESGAIVHEAMTFIPNWTPEASSNYTYYGFWDGEYNTNASIGNQASIDNIYFSNDVPTYTYHSLENKNLNVYPNPSSSNIHLHLDGFTLDHLSLEILDQMGRTLDHIRDIPDSYFSYQITDLPKGQYHIRVWINDQATQTIIRFVKI